MRTIISIILLAWLPLLLTAQNSEESKKILDQAYRLYEQSNGIRLSFTISVKEADGTAYQPQSGTALIKGNKFKLETESMETWFDGKTQWVYLKDANEVNVSTPTAKELVSISPLALLSMYKSGFVLKNPIDKKVSGRNASQIELKPVSQQSDYNQISVTVDKQNFSILEVNLTMKNNAKSSIVIKNYNANNNFLDATFIFNKSSYPNAEVIDLR